MASAVALIIGGAVVNNFLFSKLGKTQDTEKDREWHDKADEQLETAQTAWSRKKLPRLDFINEQMQTEHHAEQSSDDVHQAMKQYYCTTDKQLDPLPPEPKLSIYYTPLPDQQTERLHLSWLGWQCRDMLRISFCSC